MLAFIDESGYPRPTDAVKNPVLLAVCMHETDIKPVTNRIYKLKSSIYGTQDEIKSTKLLREATITKNRTNAKCFVEGMVEIAASVPVSIFAVIMERPAAVVTVPEHHLPKQYYLLLKKIEFFCARHRYGKSLLIFDEVNEAADRKIAEAVTGFLFKTSFGRSFDHILEMPLFVSSAVTPAIQLADIFAGIVRHYHENDLDDHAPESGWQEWIISLYRSLYALTENNRAKDRNLMEYGFQKMGRNYDFTTG